LKADHNLKAMVFAAGLGSRLGDLTKNTPKCLLTAGGKTLLLHVLEHLKMAGVETVVINLHYLHQQIIDYLASNNNFDLEIKFSYESELLGTGGGLKFAQKYFKEDEDFIIYNSDIYCSLDLTELIAQHNKQKNLATLCVMKRETNRYLYFNQAGNLSNWSSVSNQNNREAEDLHLEKLNANDNKFAFAGIHICAGRIFKYFVDDGNFSIIKTYLRASIAGEKLSYLDISDKYWKDIGKPETLAELRSYLGNN
jgi:NDP-sugar pyrophosphorylase family protein